MHTTYLRLPVGEVYAEFPSVVHGNQWLDAALIDGELLLYAGRLHIVARPDMKRGARWVGAATAFTVALLTNVSDVQAWISSLF